MKEYDEARGEIAERLALDFFIRCLRLPKGVTVMSEAEREASQILSLKGDGWKIALVRADRLDQMDEFSPSEDSDGYSINQSYAKGWMDCLRNKIIWQGE